MTIETGSAPEPTGPGRRGRTAWLLRQAGAAVAGLAAAAAALAAGELVSAFTGPATAPALAVGSAAIDLTPTPLKEYAIRQFGTNDKTVLLTGIYSVLGLLAVAAGLLAVRRRWAGVVVFALFGLLGVWAELSRAGSSRSAALPAIAAALVGALVLSWLAGRHRAVDTAVRPGTSRRQFILATTGTLALAALGGIGGRTLSAARNSVTAARNAVRLPAPAKALPALPAAAHPAIPGLSPLYTPNSAFYRVDIDLTLPQIDPRDWSLRIHGQVDHPMTLSFDELLRLPLEELDHTLSCVSNEVGGPYVGTTRWLGASLPALLRRAGVRSGADQLVGRSRDGMSIGSPLDAVLDGRTALLAVAMDGEVLPIAHGFPCRTVIPGLYGYTSATKWLVDLEVTTFAVYDPYWVKRGWGRQGVVKTASRIEVPAGFAKVPAGTVTVAGTAWATHRGIAAVEVRVDGGPWQQARLAADAGPDVWRQWSLDWHSAPPGTHTLQVRVTDAGGAVQPEARATPFPDGATGWHSVVVTVV